LKSEVAQLVKKLPILYKV